MDERSVASPGYRKWTRQKARARVIIIGIIFTMIIVFISAMLYVWSLDYIRSSKQAPKINAECYIQPNGNYCVFIGDVDPDPVGIISCNYMMLDENGDVIHGNQGSIKDIYCLDLVYAEKHQDAVNRPNITFMDSDTDGKISEGDRFFIRSHANGGVGGEGGALKLIFEITGETMTHVALSNEMTRNVEIPTSGFNITMVQYGEFEQNNRTGVIDRFHSVQSQTLHYNLSCRYIGSKARNISIEMLVEEDWVERFSVSINSNQSVFINGSHNTYRFDPIPFYEIQNLTVILKDMDTNETLLMGYITYHVVQVFNTSPSFLHPPPLQAVTVMTIALVGFWNSRKRFC